MVCAVAGRNANKQTDKPMTTNNPIPTNKPGSKQFEETMQAFEAIVLNPAFDRIKGREGRDVWKFGAYYCDGEINALFKGFLHGMAYSRTLVNLA